MAGRLAHSFLSCLIGAMLISAIVLPGTAGRESMYSLYNTASSLPLSNAIALKNRIV